MSYDYYCSELKSGLAEIFNILDNKLTQDELRRLCNEVYDVFEAKKDEIDLKEENEIKAEYKKQIREVNNKFRNYCDFIKLMKQKKGQYEY